MDYDYSQLQPELVEAIAKKINGLIDYVRFRSVRSDWRSIISRRPHQLPCQLPWLMLPFDVQKYDTTLFSTSKEIYRTEFFDFSENKIRQWWVPEFRRWIRCCGSSHGWLALFDLVNKTILLVNPITAGSRIHLPPITTFQYVWCLDFENFGQDYLINYSIVEHPHWNSLQDFFIKKIVLSSPTPSPDKDYLAVAVLGFTAELAFCKKGDESWTIIEAAKSYCEDVIFSKGLMYAVNKEGSLIFVDVNCLVSNVSPAVGKISPPKPVPDADMIYLVDSFMGILLVTRYLESKHDPDLDSDVHKTTRFDVFSLDAGKPKWDEVKSLGNHVLFLGGKNDSLCLLATEYYGCEGNCIYFTDDFCRKNEVDPGDHDVGVFSLGDRTIKPLLPLSTGSRLSFPSPIWFTANPCSS